MNILSTYRSLRLIPSGSHYYNAYRALQFYVIDHQDELFDLIFANETTDQELDTLIMFGRIDDGSCRVCPEWQPFFQRVYARKTELPRPVQMQLDWLHNTHGW